jgi:very-short-patch-repair endonuclease
MPAKRSNPKTMRRAGELRKEPTPAERKLWAYLRGDKLKGVSFRRQHAIGDFIPDFVSIKKKLVIEVDGTPFGRNISNKKTTMPSGQNISSQKATK